MNKNGWMETTVSKWVVMLAALSFFVAGAAQGGEPEAQPDIQNIGFLKGPPAELKTRFPMCEEFLDVQWIDKKYMVGYATYDAFVRKKASDPAVRKRVYAIVAIPFGVPRRYDYDAYQFVRQGKLKDLFELIKSAQNVSAGLAFSIGEGDTRIDLHPGGALSYGESHPLLSDHRKTVCIVYPQGDKAWIIEGKTVERAYTEDQIQQHIESLRRVEIKTSLEFFRQMWVLDVNDDKVMDFVKPRILIYSANDRMRKTFEEFKYPNFIYTFPGVTKTCRVDSNKMNFDLTTDGKSYFASGCNWTELSSMK